jgi:hypothetical protein
MLIGKKAKIYLNSGLPDGTYIYIPKTPMWVNFGGPLNG